MAMGHLLVQGEGAEDDYGLGEAGQGFPASNALCHAFAEMLCLGVVLSTLMYRSIQNNYRETCFLMAMNSNYRYRIVLPEELISITETDLWEW